MGRLAWGLQCLSTYVQCRWCPVQRGHRGRCMRTGSTVHYSASASGSGIRMHRNVMAARGRVAIFGQHHHPLAVASTLTGAPPPCRGLPHLRCWPARCCAAPPSPCLPPRPRRVHRRGFPPPPRSCGGGRECPQHPAGCDCALGLRQAAQLAALGLVRGQPQRKGHVAASHARPGHLR